MKRYLRISRERLLKENAGKFINALRILYEFTNTRFASSANNEFCTNLRIKEFDYSYIRLFATDSLFVDTEVDLNDLRQLIDQDGAKVIIVENGKPILVVFSFEEYRKRFNSTNRSTQNSLEMRFTSELPKELEEEPLKIEDLPV